MGPGIFAVAFMVGYAALMLGSGVYGLVALVGTGWAVAGLFTALVYRFTLPLVLAAFVCASEVWGWPWPFALLFAAPGLSTVVPGLFHAIASSLVIAKPNPGDAQATQ